MTSRKVQSLVLGVVELAFLKVIQSLGQPDYYASLLKLRGCTSLKRFRIEKGLSSWYLHDIN